jgi:hypothetical protein
LKFESLKIVALVTLGAVLFGIAHDMVTAHVCVEYFTIGHKNIFGRHHDGPSFAYALYWGVVATWWVGLPAGVVLALVARVPGLPKLTWRQVARPMAVALLLLWLAAITLLLVNLPLGRRGIGGIFVPRPELGEVEDRFLTVAGVHMFSYNAAPIVVLVVAAVLVWKRIKARRKAGVIADPAASLSPSAPDTPPAAQPSSHQ